MNYLGSYRRLFCFLYPLMHLLFPIRVAHPERLPDGPVVLCAPHSSMLDPLFLMMALTIRRFPRFLAKKELFRIPVLGAILRGIGTIPVDRGNVSVSTVRSALAVLKEGGILGIFPEGTRVQEEFAVGAKSGAVMLASRTGAPLVPVWLPRKKHVFRKVEIVIGEPYALPKLHGGAEYHRYAEELMRRIGLLKEEAVSCS